MATVGFFLLSLAACYLLALLIGALGMSRMAAPARFHWTALIMLFLMWLYGSAGPFRDAVGRPDLLGALYAFLPAVGVWWLHHLLRRRPPASTLPESDKKARRQGGPSA